MVSTYGEDASAPTSTATFGTAVYTYAVKGSTEFSATVPTNAGEYTVKATVAATDDYPAGTATADFVIEKAVPTLTAPTGRTLTYNGQSQELVTAGEAIGGTLYYAVTSDKVAPTDDLYTASIPAKTNAGTYRVWYRVTGDQNHEDTEPAFIEIVIAKKALTITADSASKEYDGEALTKDGYSVSEDGLAEGDTMEGVNITGTQTEAGSSDNVASSAKIINAAGEDVTANYEITYEKGTLTVTEKQEEQKIQPGDVNGDGKVNRLDRIYLARHLAGWTGYEIKEPKAADVNGDGKVNRMDRIYLVRYLAGWKGYVLAD